MISQFPASGNRLGDAVEADRSQPQSPTEEPVASSDDELDQNNGDQPEGHRHDAW